MYHEHRSCLNYMMNVTVLVLLSPLGAVAAEVLLHARLEVVSLPDVLPAAVEVERVHHRLVAVVRRRC